MNPYTSLRKIISPFYRYLEMRYKMMIYNHRKDGIRTKIRNKKKIRVAFLTVNLPMWKYDRLFRLLLDDPLFEPLIVTMPRPMFNLEAEKDEQLRLLQYCRELGYPVIPGYDYDKNVFNGADIINADIVFFSQPYNAAYKEHKIEAFWDKSLFCYVPYCITIEKANKLSNMLLKNICEYVFCETEEIRAIESKMLTNRAANFRIAGFISAEQLAQHEDSDEYEWKDISHNRKRVIWAPHHSILPTDVLNYSTFLNIADDMLKIAEEYSDRIDFCFKPHPGLKAKLYDLPDWGKEKTDNYYSKWSSMPNTSVNQGEYMALFRSSDALIHDCSSFSVEYILTGKPVLYVTKSDHMEYMNQLGASCYNMHYKGADAKAIRHFIEDVVISGNDTMRTLREDFVRTRLIPSGNKSTSEIIHQYLSDLVRASE